MDEEFIPKVSGANIGISFFEGELEPVIVLTFHPVDGPPVNVAISPQDLESCMPAFIGAAIRARTVQELVTIYPEKREEMIKNIMFRWTGTIVGDEEDGTSQS
jgi:hypothetical protein